MALRRQPRNRLAFPRVLRQIDANARGVFVKRRVVLGVGAALALGVTEGKAMGQGPYVICSPLEGRLIDAEGAPVSGARITRSWRWTRGEGEDGAVTDAEGRFRFEAVHGRRGLLDFLPGEVTIRQRFTADAGDGPQRILTIFKRDYDLNSEAEGRPVRLRCTLGAEPDFSGFHSGTCEWVPQDESI
jgi:hypothetical protein